MSETSSTSVRAVGFKIRAARRGDAPEIVALLATEGIQSNAETVGWLVSHPETELIVAVQTTDRVIGVVTLYHGPWLRLGGRGATISDLCVHTTRRRERIGSELVKRAVERAKVLSAKRIEASAISSDVARAFWSSCGFDAATAAVWKLEP